MEINHDELIFVLNKVFNAEIIQAKWQTKELQGGTIGYVNLVIGVAENNKNEKYPFNIVLKVDKERPIDKSKRWHREYDLYRSDFCKIFSDMFCMPKCFYAELNNGEVKIWMEYINGESGNDLTIEMLEKVAIELGHFQGRL
ncbi:MAG: hypothetical protein LBH44_04805 [Treponema sp.]|jgi:hypothetical protein|nr:hypothetical protein [Treponema sp.]